MMLTFASHGMTPNQEQILAEQIIALDGLNGRVPSAIREASGRPKKNIGKRARNRALALGAICEAGEITNQNLAEVIGVSGQTSRTYIDELEDEGLVVSEMVRFESNIRRRVCRPTDKGREFLAA